MGTITIHTVQRLNEQGTCVSKRCTIELIVLLLPAFVYMRARKLLVLFRRVHLPARRALCFCVASQLQLHPRGSSTLKRADHVTSPAKRKGQKRRGHCWREEQTSGASFRCPPAPFLPRLSIGDGTHYRYSWSHAQNKNALKLFSPSSSNYSIFPVVGI